MNTSLVRRVVPILIAIVLLVYALKDISFGAIGEQFQRANYGLIALVGLLFVVSYFVRGIRWQQPLAALGYRPTAFRTTVAMQTGMIASMIVIGSGELTRCATLQRTDGVPVSQGLGSVVAERIVDLAMLAVVLLLTFMLELRRMQSYVTGLSLALPGPYWVVGGLIVALVAGLLIWWAAGRSVVRQHPLVLKGLNLLSGFGRGFMAIRQLPRPGLFIFLTVFYQVLAWLATYLLLLAVNSTHDLPPTAALTILAVASLGGLAVPTQGGIGTYHFLVSRALVLYGFTTVQGAVAATFLHAVGFGINLLLSGVSFLILPFLLRQRSRVAERATPGA